MHSQVDTAQRADVGTRSSNSDWQRAVFVGMAAYVVSRLCILAAAGVRASQMAVDARKDGVTEPTAYETISNVLTSWDGKWYIELIRRGYPDFIPADITYEQLEARAAFFPVYPWTVRAVDAVLPGGDTIAALSVNFVLGAIAVFLVGLLARRLYSVSVAARAMTLFAVFPGSFVLSFAYSEATLIVLVAACLLLLLDERWLLAGLVAAVATGARPNGIAIVAACAVASVLAIRRSRDWWSLAAPLLAPIGFVAFQLYVDHTAGERGAWFRVQREAWAEGTSFGYTAIENTFGFITNPLGSPTDALTALTVAALIAATYCAWKVRLSLVLSAYSLVVVALMLAPATVTARPRFMFTAFPLLIAVAAWWPDPDDDPDHHRASWDPRRLGPHAGAVRCRAGRGHRALRRVRGDPVTGRTLVVVPTHNEADNISLLLDQLDAVVPDADVLVIDDASTDATRAIVRSRVDGTNHLRLVERADKRGLGDAYREAFRIGLADGYELLVQIDADLSHDTAALPLMLAVADSGIAAVIGSRYIPGGTVTGWPRRRTWLSRWANRYVAVMLGLAINDATAGYRVYRAETLDEIGLDDLQASGYGFQVEMTYRAVRAGLAVVEIPISFRDRVAGQSKMDRRVVLEAFRLVTAWGIRDLVSLRRRRRAYRTTETPTGLL